MLIAIEKVGWDNLSMGDFGLIIKNGVYVRPMPLCKNESYWGVSIGNAGK